MLLFQRPHMKLYLSMGVYEKWIWNMESVEIAASLVAYSDRRS